MRKRELINNALILVGISLSAVIFFSFPTLIGRAQTPQPANANDVNRVAHQLYCPVCENITLDVCPTPACEQWRELIAQKLSAGWSDQQIIDYFIQQYGERVVGMPPRHGLNWTIYLLPPLVILAAVVFVVAFFTKGKKAKEDSPQAMKNGQNGTGTGQG